MFKLYLAGPISGLSNEKVMTRLGFYKRALSQFQIFSPMTGKDYLRNEQVFKLSGYAFPASTDHAIFERDKWMVSQCDIVLVDFMGAEKISVGSVMELAWASLLGKHTVVIMEVDNIHRRAFVLEAADIIFNGIGDALKYLHKLATE